MNWITFALLSNQIKAEKGEICSRLLANTFYCTNPEAALFPQPTKSVEERPLDIQATISDKEVTSAFKSSVSLATQSVERSDYTNPSTTIQSVRSKESDSIRKEGFNYASFDCGALIRGTNKEATHSTAILLNSKDAYMLNPCSANKFVEIQICQDILVREITLANFEFFSSQFKDFNVYGSSKLPPEWVLLGNFKAQNVQGRQHFIITDPKLWVKYIRIEFLTHYGQEFFCPLTSVQIFGVNMLDDIEEAAPTSTAEFTATLITAESANLTTSTLATSSICARPTSPSFPNQDKTSSATPITSSLSLNHIEITQDPPTSTPSEPAKQDSIFSKIMQRIMVLEKLSSKLEEDFNNLEQLVSTTEARSLNIFQNSEKELTLKITEEVSI